MIHPTLPRSPLALVVAQIRFSPVEDIKEKYIPVIRDKLKNSGFPYYEVCPTQQITMTGSELQLSGAEQWFFTDKKRQNNIALAKNFLTFNTVHYENFDQFLHQIASATNEIAGILELKEYGALERINLRYVDWLYPLDGVSLEEMINEEFLGGFLEKDEDVLLRQVILERRTSVGLLRTILFKPNDVRAVVGEFQTIRLNQPKFTAGKDFLILDMEHSTTVQGEDFSNEHIQTTLTTLHESLDDLFFNVIPTKEAIEIWKKEAK